MKKLLIMPALVLILAMAAPLSADIYIEQINRSSRNTDNSENGVMRMWISEQAVRMEEPDGKTVHITDFANERLITLDNERKAYFVIPLDKVRNDFARASSRLKSRIEMNWRVEWTDKEEMISGFKCKLVRFHGRGTIAKEEGVSPLSITIEFWLSNDTGVPADFSDKLFQFLGMRDNPFVDSTVLKELNRIGGYPVKSVTSIEMDSISDTIEQTALNIESVNVEPGFYSVPEGYSLMQNPVQ